MQLNHASVKREMAAQRWTVTQLAAELDMNRATLSSYLTGRRTISANLLEGLQRVLNVNPYMLLGPEDPQGAIADLIATFGVSESRLAELDVPRHIWCDHDEMAA